MGYLVTTRDEYNPESDRFVSKLYFFAFDTLYPIPYVRAELAEAPFLWDFQPSIDYTPGDNIHIAYRGTDNKIWYYTWRSFLTRDLIRHGCAPDWDGPFQVSGFTCEPASSPSIDADGDRVYCAFRGPNANGEDIGEIYRRTRYLNEPPVWRDHVNVSRSPDQESRHAQCHTGTTVTWQEWCPTGDTEVFASFQGEIENLSQDPDPTVHCKYPHGAVRNPIPPEPFVIRLHAAWTKVTAQRERFIHYKTCKYIPRFAYGADYPSYLTGELGCSERAPYCVARDSCKDYGNARVDYSLTELKYELPFLSPTRNYLAELVFFNGEQQKVVQELNIGGRVVTRLTLEPGTCETLRLRLPKSAYQQTKARLGLKRLSGPFACLANSIKVYETTPSSDNGPMGSPVGLGGQPVSAHPNPFRTACEVRFRAAGHAVAKVFDSNGRFVRDLAVNQMHGGVCMATWNGTDASGKFVAPGVYYCVLSSGGGRSCVKVGKQ